MAIGKLNYTNRGSEGPKLGLIVAKDLRKKAAKIHAQGKDDVAHRQSSPIELCLTGKNLTDEGLQHVIDGLADALSLHWSDDIPCFVLEELNLCDNGLTTRSLRALAPIIQYAAEDIKDLDLSRNKICVQSKEEAEDWRIFLQAFRKACSPRRLVFSENDLSGPSAFEILSQTYATHSPNGSNEPQGLRSIPYLVFSNVKLDDMGVLWLSYFLELHPLPKMLASPLRPGPMANTIASYEVETGCHGIIYSPNEQVSIFGRRLLAAAETARRKLTQEVPDEFSENTRPYRKLSATSISDLDSLRRKLQRASMDNGFHRVELWHTAVRVAAVSRALLCNREEEATFGLDKTLWYQIIGFAENPNGALDPMKFAKAFQFGTERDTLAEFRDIQGKSESHQIWHLLDATDCLSYDMVELEMVDPQSEHAAAVELATSEIFGRLSLGQ
ncbi:hypothetical protein BT63DRAFT_4877 [Microthyrium microscopicum]|uniref:RNI-like protein n=1 Tax=Microthyrium microscopicum TaxID=703497 RepID=A0A6A6URW8_9PEZI|nr:hypothetical protein BT63DRAFT_4877 [Microthyrium microscopicum]